MLYIIIWTAVLICSIIMFKKVSGSLSLLKPNLISLSFYYSLLFSSFIGSLLIVLNIDDNYMIDRINNPEVRMIGFFWICFIMIVFPLSMLIISKLCNFNAREELNTFLECKIITPKDQEKDFFFVFVVLSVISVASVFYTLISVESIPIFEMLLGNDNLAQLRIDASHNFTGNIYIKNIFALNFTPVLALVAYVYSVNSNKRRWRFLFVILLIMSVMINIYDLQKAPIFFFILMFLLVNIYIGKIKLNVKKVIIMFTFAVSLVIILYVFVQGVTSVEEYLTYKSGPIGRIILSQIAPFYLHLDMFGDTAAFLNGRSLPGLLLSLYDLEQVRSAKLVMDEYFPERVEQGIAGVLNTLYAGEAFANFGYKGIFFGTIYIAVIIQVIYIVFIRLPKHPIIIGVFVYFTVNIPRVLVGGFTDFLFNPIWIIVVSVLLGSLLMIVVKKDLVNGFRGFKEPQNN
ncbi:MAG TPA: O-antigen polymerase [Niallia sp.]|nr:O-antigen polymerase [Niallia sp.]